jgi:antitoxin component of MazEF toxin-antitoxin module
MTVVININCVSKYNIREVDMKSTVKKIGNSQGVIITSGMLKSLGLTLGDMVEMLLDNNEVIIRKTKQVLTIEELFEGYQSLELPEIVRDEPKGREL